MRLLKFSGKRLHDFLDVEFSFNEELTFLVGNNGSGKTSSLEAINALLSPSLIHLAKLDHESLSLTFLEGGKERQLSSRKVENRIAISLSDVNQDFEFLAYVSDPEAPSYRDRDHEQEYYREIVSRNSQHPVMVAINALPSPMFLGLNRRAAAGFVQAPQRYPTSKTARSRRNIFSGSLGLGVNEAIDLAQTQHRDVLIEISRLGEKLRRDMLLELLRMDNRKGLGPMQVPSTADLQRIPQMRKGIPSLAKILGLTVEQVSSKLEGILDELEHSSKRIPKNKSIEKIMQMESSEGREVVDAVVKWSLNAPELRRIQNLLALVENYNESVKAISKSNDRYKFVIDNFLSESGKSIVFNNLGYLEINLSSDKGRIPVSSLSSGESQIFVIITHLFFNNSVKNDNVFIIDEPELSLHVQWQEIFVESVMSSNPGVQYVLATHSPSIILDRVNACVDVKASYSVRV